MDTFLGGCAERTANALTPSSATMRIATMTIHIRFFLPPAAGAGGATGSAKVPPPSAPDTVRARFRFARTVGAYLMVSRALEKIIEPRLNDAPFGQSLDHGLHARGGEVSLVDEELS